MSVSEFPSQEEDFRSNTSSLNSVLVEVRGTEDTTRRPRRPGIPRYWTRQPPPRGPSTSEEPPAK